MLKTTFILITVLCGVICGNRLMDNRLLRSASSSLHPVSYKSIGEVNMELFNEKTEDDLKLKTLENPLKAIDAPCGSELYFERDVTTRHCSDNVANLLKYPTNYLTYDSTDDEPILNVNTPKSYPSVIEFDDVFEVEPPTLKKRSKNKKVLLKKLNMLPVANYKDFYEDLVMETVKEEMPKRNGNSLVSGLGSQPPPRGCDCKIRNDLVDLGQQHFPRYLLNAVCHTDHSGNDFGPKCWSGSVCRPLEYKVKVLTFRSITDDMQKDPTLAWLPDDLRQIWKFKTITVTAGCFCS